MVSPNAVITAALGKSRVAFGVVDLAGDQRRQAVRNLARPTNARVRCFQSCGSSSLGGQTMAVTLTAPDDNAVFQI